MADAGGRDHYYHDSDGNPLSDIPEAYSGGGCGRSGEGIDNIALQKPVRPAIWGAPAGKRH